MELEREIIELEKEIQRETMVLELQEEELRIDIKRERLYEETPNIPYKTALGTIKEELKRFQILLIETKQNNFFNKKELEIIEGIIIENKEKIKELVSSIALEEYLEDEEKTRKCIMETSELLRKIKKTIQKIVKKIEKISKIIFLPDPPESNMTIEINKIK